MSKNSKGNRSPATIQYFPMSQIVSIVENEIFRIFEKKNSAFLLVKVAGC